ncbi:zf-LYAR-domain-containing protein [Suhomyces tanzawaensis NRRL Y-17324]|uniref:Zf-LYAR-domain-containing protein n=1 Tax=Suhomyces tanzawaensis NRRL Y-17324 TaxID=984487 RepID=A0A1E4SJ58_9ASCO|nr:zf-LYAR-domain-containing protein [Suhomyces tanzawaensis NRRL Y-17324]ODV79534.1 zf-LYAR-domain-containing protein [Suhomyces tanzawaensis NRRL Y-17324]
MVSFSCEVCNDTVIKKKLDQHTQRCYGAYFTCIDCSVTFLGTDYRQHTSCISEAEKYEKALYKGPKKQPPKPKVEQTTKVVEKKVEKVEKAEKAEKSEKSEKASKTSSKKAKSQTLTDYLKPKKEQNLYKVIKKVSQESSQDIKELLKALKVVKNADGKLEIIQ